MATSFGIHVGNTSACLAVSKEGKTDVVAAPTGDRVTPAVVSYTDSEVIVGLPAKQGRPRNMPNTVVNNKRLLVGRASQEELAAGPVTVVEEDGQHFYVVQFKEEEFKTSPSEVLTHIYAYLHTIAASHCREVEDCHCVLTAPLDFSAEERGMLARLATAVGFKVVQVVSEPAAACLAYGLGQIDQGDTEHVLVYRAGGLSTDLALVLVAGGVYSVLESVAMDGLGGHQVTEVLLKFLAGEFKAKYHEDILQSKKGRAKLAGQAETVKQVLSTLDTAHCYVESLYDGMDFSSNVTRARFDNQLGPVLSELMAPVSVLLTRAGLAAEDIDKVVLVGGTGKVVKLQRTLENLFTEAEVLNTIAPDEVLAYGAAMQAGLVTNTATAAPRETMMATSQDITARVVGAGEEEEEVDVIVASTPLPVKRSVPVAATGASTTVEVVWGEETVLASLVLETSAASKLVLSVHIHRDGSTTCALQDKAVGGGATSVVLSPAAPASTLDIEI